MSNSDDKTSIGFIAEFLQQNVSSVPADNTNIFQRASERASAEGIELNVAFKEEMETRPSNNFGTNQSLFTMWSQK
ncbi:MAG: hypothetical protein QOF62_103 [Pyrinomonadaceae bacterium]|jgi:hypothetical protein|nr:hypothetical protein [Pyrinomonadaceae bacterium]